MTDDEEKITSNVNKESIESSVISTEIDKNEANDQVIEAKFKKDIELKKVNVNEDNTDVMGIENNEFTSAKNDTNETTNQNSSMCWENSKEDIENIDTIQAEMKASKKVL